VSAKVNDQAAYIVAFRNEFRSESDAQRGDSVLFNNLPPEDQVTVGSVLAQRLSVHEGDSITLETKAGPRELRIARVANEYAAGGLTVRMRRELAERLTGIEGVDAYVVKADHTKLKEVEESLRVVCAKQGMLLQSYSDLTMVIEGMMAGVVGSLWGLLVLGLIVAAFGVVNTLGMNVLEQTRELSLLRVVAMTRSQVRRAIVAQAAMLGILGVAPGLLAGLAMAYVMNLSTLPVIGHPVAFTFHPFLLLGGFLAAMTIVLAAAWIPAERAARLELAAALHYE
jgi:putative ABC transport system permease protein